MILNPIVSVLCLFSRLTLEKTQITESEQVGLCSRKKHLLNQSKFLRWTNRNTFQSFLDKLVPTWPLNYKTSPSFKNSFWFIILNLGMVMLPKAYNRTYSLYFKFLRFKKHQVKTTVICLKLQKKVESNSKNLLNKKLVTSFSC